jgi:hypothetical protein
MTIGMMCSSAEWVAILLASRVSALAAVDSVIRERKGLRNIPWPVSAAAKLP